MNDRAGPAARPGAMGHDTTAVPADAAFSEPFPLSHAQKRLWFTHRLRPEHAHNTLRIVRLRGELDASLLERSINEIVARHDSLRTSFLEEDGVPFQVVATRAWVTLEKVDLTSVPPCGRDEEIQRAGSEAAYLRFDLARGPLVSMRLLRFDATDYVLIVAIDHLVNDGMSWSVFNHELETLYNYGLQDRPVDLPPPEIQYRDHIAMEQKALRADMPDGLVYWKSRLEGCPAVELPVERLAWSGRSDAGAKVSTTLSPEVVQSLKELGETHGCSLFMIILTGLKLLLHRCTGQTDILVGTLVSGRSGRRKLRSLIGFLINVMPCRTDLGDDPSVSELLSRVRENLTGDYAHCNVPFEAVVEALRPDRGGGHGPLIDVAVNYRKWGWFGLDLAGLDTEPVKIDRIPAQFPLQLNVEEGSGAVFVQFVYEECRYEARRMEHLLSQFVYLLEQAAADPGRAISSLSLVTPQSASVLPDPAEPLLEAAHESVISRFVRHARADGARTAVEHGAQRCSYDQLLREVAALAAVLKQNGLGGGAVVAVTGERCIGLVVAIVAVMASGGVVLPVDPALPVKRRQLVVAEAGAKALLAVGEPGDAGGEWVDDDRVAIWCLDATTGRAAGVQAPSVDISALPVPEPEALAYIFFTSGSTGVPKGVLGLHKGVDHFIDWQVERFDIGPDDRVAQLTRLSFDPLLRDLFLPLACGATICLPVEADSRDELRWIDEARITVLHIAPTLATVWLADRSDRVSLDTVRWVFFAGEPLPGKLVNEWRRTFPNGNRIVNLYGPTETTMVKCFHEVPDTPAAASVPVGKPLPGSQVLVMHDGARPCGIGECGEIVVRTPYRAAGYVNQADETRQRFRRNPFTSDDGDLLYLTGDRGYYRSDGNIEILGRIDDQFKVRGVRIEPGEIAATLRQHDSVHGCFVVPVADAEGGNVIVAYVLAAPGAGEDEAGIRELARRRLPAAMVPSVVCFVERFPLLPNGKINRKVLPEPDLSRRAREYVGPRNEIEIEIAAIWSGLLGVERIGAHDDFFELGGHSLTATQSVSRICTTFDVDLALHSLFDYPTVAELADVIAQKRAAG